MLSPAIPGSIFHVLLCLLLVPALIRADENDTFERFLSRLGLAELQTQHLEQVLDTIPAGMARQRTAERLADLYAGQLVEHSENKSAYDRVLQKIQRLVEKVPEAKTGSLEVMLLQADYFRAETLMSKWTADHSAVAARDEAAAILSRIAPQLDIRQQQLNAAAERLSNEVDATKEIDEQEAKSKELGRLQAVAGRAAFFAAWANYYVALSSQSAAAPHPGFVKARDIFRHILGIDGSYTDVEAEGLALESVWRARTLIGLGLAEAASGNLAGSRACFDLLQRGRAPAEIQELAAYWQLQALLNANQLAEALKYARAQVADFGGQASQGRVSFCVSLVQVGFGGQATDPVIARELGMLGVTGLIKLKQQSALRQLVQKYDISLDQHAGFYLLWLKGQQQLEAAEKSKREEDYSIAAQSFSTALEAPDAKTELGAAAQCRYQLAWCQYRLGQFELAAKNYEQARDGLKPSDSKSAADAAWMAFVCYQTLAKSQRRYVAAAINVLSAMQRDFPDNAYSKRADYYRGKLQQAAQSPAETLANLERVSPNSPDYLSAQFDICQLLYDQWRQAPAHEKQSLIGKLTTAADRYLQAAQSDPDTSRKLRVCLLAADANLNGEPPNDTTALRFLDTGRPWTGSGADSILVAEFRYRSLQLATHRGDDAARRRHADWIIKNAPGSPYELPALTIAAKSLDDQLQLARTAPSELTDEAYRVYQRLSTQYGDSPEILKSKKNAQVALSRLAQYAFQLGHYAEASEHLQKLLAEFPDDPNYVRRAGLADFHAQNYSQAIERWRTLVTALPKGSDEWFEAKYYQLACLSHLDRTKAREAIQQFHLLFPELGPPAWREKFGELEKGLLKG